MELSEEKNVIRNSTVLRWLVIVGLAFVTNLLLLQITRTVFHEPRQEMFCESKQVIGMFQTEGDCLSAGGQWNAAVPDKTSGVSGYCNEQYACQKKFDEANALYQRNGFLVSVIGGTLLLILSVFLPVSASAVANGLSVGAILSFIVGSTGYWSYMGEWLRLVVLFVAFIALILLAIKKLGK